MTANARQNWHDRAQAGPPREISRAKRTFRGGDRFAVSRLDSPKRSVKCRPMAGTKKDTKVGRRPKLDDALMSRISGQIMKGNHIKTACLSIGLGYSTYFEWKAQGEQDRKDGKKNKFVDFVNMIDHADAVAQQRLLKIVIDTGGWKGALEVLKRRWPKEFGDRTALSNADGSPIPIAGGAPVHVTFKFDQPEKDAPWEIDPSALPPAPDDDQPDTPPTNETPARP